MAGAHIHVRSVHSVCIVQCPSMPPPASVALSRSFSAPHRRANGLHIRKEGGKSQWKELHLSAIALLMHCMIHACFMMLSNPAAEETRLPELNMFYELRIVDLSFWTMRV